MRISDQPTEYVLLRVLAMGSWTPYHFAVLHLTDPWLFIMKQRLKAMNPFKNDKTFYTVTYCDEPMGYYACEEEDEIGQILIDLYADNRSWCFVALDDPDEYLDWRAESKKMEAHMLMINPDSSSSYMCFNRVRDYEFATEMFRLKDMLGAEQ